MSVYDETADPQLEEIVAYLDGELSGEASARVEQRLASDESFRQQLQSMERAWGALAQLPMATVDDRFSRTTMSMVVEAAAEEVQARTRALPIARRRRWMTSGLAASVALAMGFLAFRLAWHNPNRMLLADLAVIDNVDIYSQFEDVQFLRLLQEQLGDELERLSGDTHDLDARQQHFANVIEPAKGEQWLGAMNDEERTALRSKFNRFRELPPGEQDRLRALHREIVSSSDARRLERTMLAYQQWLGGLPPVKQFELRNNDDAVARVALIQRWSSQMRNDELLTLTDAELQAFFSQMLRPIMRLGREEMVRSDPAANRDRLKMLLLGKESGRWRRELADQFDGRGDRDWFYGAVMNALPGHARTPFASLPTQGKIAWFLAWMRQHTTCRGEVTHEELEEFFSEELDLDARAQLLALPPGEMEQALRQMYRCQPKPGFEGRFMWPAAHLIGDANRGEANGRDGDRNGDGRDRGDGDRNGRGRGDGDRGGGDRGGDDRGGRDREDWDRDDGRRRGPRRGEPGPPPPGFRPPMEFGARMRPRDFDPPPFGDMPFEPGPRRSDDLGDGPAGPPPGDR